MSRHSATRLHGRSPRAQQPERMRHIGVLSPAPNSPTAQSYMNALKQEMRALGYVEGQNLVLSIGRAEGHFDRLPALASELVAQRPDLIAAIATPAVAAAQRATKTIPIVMVATTDPSAAGLSDSLARPGGNITGVSNMSVDVTAKALEILREILPNAIRIAVLMSTNPVHRGQYREVEVAARAIGTILTPVTATGPEGLNNAF